MNDDDFFYPHEVDIVEPGGATSLGPAAGVEQTRRAEVKDEQQLVLTDDGREIVSNTQVTVPLEHAAPLGSSVTVWKGTPRQRTSMVIGTSTNDNRGTPLDSFVILHLR